MTSHLATCLPAKLELNPEIETQPIGTRDTRRWQVGKKRVGRVPKAFRYMAVGRLNPCKHIVALAKELGISRRLLSRWRE